MWRKIPSILGTLIFLSAFAAFGYAWMIDEILFLIFAGLMFTSGMLYLILLQLLRLTSDWPPGIIFAAGVEAERKRRRRRARRGRTELVSIGGEP